MNVRRIKPADPETKAVAAMVDGAFDYYSGPYWEWKYADPGGPESVIMVAEDGDEVVGCNHYLVMPYQLGSERELTGLAGGDLFVNPDLRRRNIATDLSLEGRKVVAEAHPEADLVVMFTWQALGSHYENLFSYTKVKPGYRQWAKRLSWTTQLARLTEANGGLVAGHPVLAGVDHILRLDVRGAPPLELRVSREGFTPGPPDHLPVIRLRASSPEMLSIDRSKWPLFWVLAAIITGRWRVSGSPRAIREAMSVAAAYLDALRILRKA